MMFRSLRGWINKIASFGVDADRLEAVKQAESTQLQERLEQVRAERQQQQAIQQRCQRLEQQLLERLQHNQMADQWELLRTQLDRHTQKARLETQITATEDSLLTARKLNQIMPKAMQTDDIETQLAATIATDKATLTEIMPQHQAIAQHINRYFQNVADPQLQPLWIRCCQERDRLGQAGEWLSQY